MHINAFWQEILNQERLRAESGGIKVGIDRQAPPSARGGFRYGEVKHMAPRPHVIGQGADVFHPVRPRQNAGQRQAFDGHLLGIARQCRDMNRFAHTVCATIRGHEYIHRRWGLCPLNPAIGQVKFWIGQRQEGLIGIAITRHNHRGGSAAYAVDQPGIKQRVALRIGGGGFQHLVCRRQKLHLDTGFGFRIAQGMDEYIQPVDTVHRGQPKV